MLMPFQEATPASLLEKTVCRSLALLLIVTFAALRILYLLWDCPIDLVPDEAHYWDWSRNLDWSYYSKGPLVAWLIRGSWELFGSTANPAISQTLAVRMPAIVCGSLIMLGVYVLTLQIYARERIALLLTALSLFLPLTHAASFLMTIDSPYVCCWTWALILGHRAVFSKSAWAWPLLGLVIGLGILAKYTMVLWIPSFALFLVWNRDYRYLLRHWGPWTMGIIAALCCLPILIWNIQNDWVTIRHVNGLAGVEKPASTIHWLGPLVYVGGQFALLLAYWFVVWACAMFVHRPWRESEPQLQYLWWLSAGTFLVFFGFSFKTGGGYLNWPVTAYVSGLILSAGWLMRQLSSDVGWYRRLAQGCLVFSCLFGVVATLVLMKPDWSRHVLQPLAGQPTKERLYPMRRVDPTCRMRGWSELAKRVDQERAELRGQGMEPIILGARWTDASELGFYCEGHPTVYCLGPAQRDRQSQYDLWRPNPLADPEQFKGRTFIVVGCMLPELAEKSFDRVERKADYTHREYGQPLASWGIFICHGFRGFPKLKNDKHF